MFPGFPRTNDPSGADGPGARLAPGTRLAAGRQAGSPAVWHRALRSASRACCCPAAPAVIAVMPPSPARPRATDLLLCRHHYRASQQALAAAGATILDPEQQTPKAPASATSEEARLTAARMRHPSNSWRSLET